MPPPPQFPSLPQSLALELLLGVSPTPHRLRGCDTECPALPVSPPRLLCARPVPVTLSPALPRVAAPPVAPSITQLLRCRAPTEGRLFGWDDSPK